MDHHSRWGSVAELRAAFARFAAAATGLVVPAGGGLDGLAPAAEVVGFDEDAPGPAELELAVPGRHNLLNARAALAAIGLAGARRRRRGRGARRLPGGAAPARAEGRARRRPHIRRLRPPPDRGPGGARRRCASSAPERLIAVFQPHLYSRTKAFAEQFGAALALADEVAVLDVYPAREEPVGELAGVSGLDVARAAADRMGGRRVLLAARPRSGPRRRSAPALGARAQVLVTIGAGDIFKLGEALVEDGDGR